MTKITRKLTGLLDDVFGSLSGNVFAWLWFSALLIVVGAFIIFAPIETVGKGGRSLSQVVAVIGGFLLVGAGASWAWHKLDDEHQRIAIRVGESLAGLIVFAAIVCLAAWSWYSWDVPDIWHRPLTALTLGDIAQTILKLGVLFLGVSFVSGVFRKLIAHWRHG
jgi:hypothetical protein